MRLPARLAQRLVAVEQRAGTSEIELIFMKYRGMKALRLAMKAAKAAQAGEAPREPAGAKIGGLTGVAGLREGDAKRKGDSHGEGSGEQGPLARNLINRAALARDSCYLSCERGRADDAAGIGGVVSL
jgi:hypothetical protein